MRVVGVRAPPLRLLVAEFNKSPFNLVIKQFSVKRHYFPEDFFTSPRELSNTTCDGNHGRHGPNICDSVNSDNVQNRTLE